MRLRLGRVPPESYNGSNARAATARSDPEVYMKRFATLIAAAVLLGVLSSGEVWGQSRIPKEAGNWLQVTGTSINGDPDRFMVAFFEIPGTVTEPLYFAVNSPGNSGSAPDAGGTGTWSFHLVGGSGTVSNPISRQLVFTGGTDTENLEAARTGPLIQTRNFTNQTGWVYFNAVMPSQGEKIGDRYYFKIVAEAPAGNGGKNAFQVDVGFSGIDGTTPGGSSVIRAFAYAWTLNLRQTAGNTWDLFPFVTSGMTGDIDYKNWDMDSGEALAGYNRDNSLNMTTALIPNPTVSGEGTTWPINAETTQYPIVGQTGGTWRLRITETNGTEPAENTALFWFENGGTVLRTYAQRYVPTVSHVLLSPAISTATNGTPVPVTIQAIDTDGAPMPYSAPVRVTAVGGTSPLINGSDADEIITLNVDGFETFTISASDGEVELTPYTDGTGGAGNDFGSGEDVKTFVTFAADIPPTLTMASTLSYISDKVAPINIPTLIVADLGTANVGTAHGIKLRFSASGLSFLTVPTPTLSIGGPVAGTVNNTVTYSGGELTITVTNAFHVDNTLTIGAATPLQINSTTDVPGTYYLQMSVDGGITWINADKAIVVGDPNPTSTWTAGAGTTGWSNPANWSPANVPDSVTENAVVPTVSSNLYPALPAGTTTVNNLTIAAGASLDVGGSTLTINGVLSNNGTVFRQGGSTVTKTDTDSGTTVYQTVGTAIQDYGVMDYYNLTVNGASLNLSLGADLSIANALTVSDGTLVSTTTRTITAKSIDLNTAQAGYRINIDLLGTAQPLTLLATAGTSVGLGSGVGTFSLTDAELAKIRAGGLTIGASGAGTITANSVTAAGTADTGAVTLGGTGAAILSGSNVWNSGFTAALTLTGLTIGGLQSASTGSITLNRAATLDADTTFSASMLTAYGIAMTNWNLRFSVDEIALQNQAITGSGNLSIDTKTNDHPINVRFDATDDGALDINNSDLVAIAGNNYSLITIGRDDSASFITVISLPATALPPLVFEGKDNTPDLILINGAITNTAANSITFSAQTKLSANVTTAGGAVTFNQAVRIGDSSLVAVDSTNGGAAPGGATIQFASTIDAITAGSAGSLAVTSGTSTAQFGAIGSSVPLGGFTVNGGAISLTDVKTNATTGDQSYSGSAISLSGAAAGNKLTVMVKTDTVADQDIILISTLNDFKTVNLSIYAADGATPAGTSPAIQYRDAGGFDIERVVTAATVNARLWAGGALTDSGAISTGYLQMDSVGGASLDFGHSVSYFDALNTLGGDIAFVNTAAPLTLGDTSSVTTASGGSITITNAGAVIIAGDVDSGAGTVTVGTGGAGTLTRTGLGTLKGSTINLQTTTGSTGAVGENLTPILTSGPAGGTDVTLGNATDKIAGAYLSHSGTGTLTVSALNLAAAAGNPPLRIETADGYGLTLPGTPIATGTSALYLRSGSTLGISQNLSGGAVTLSAASAITQTAGAISGTSLSATSAGGLALTGANTVSAFSAINSAGGAIQLTNTAATLTMNGVTQSGTAGAITITNTGNLSNAAAMTSLGADITLTAEGADAVLTNSSSISSSNFAVFLYADSMDLGGSIAAGTGNVTLTVKDIAQPIDLGGTDTTAKLVLTDTELKTVTSAALLTIGDTAQIGGIDINAGISAAVPLTLTTNAAITRSTAAASLGATGALTLNAETGIGSIGTAASVIVGSVASLSATNSTSGDIYLETTGDVTVGVAGFGINQWSGGNAQIDAGGTLTVGGNIDLGVGTLILNATGVITEQNAGAGTLTANTVNLGTTKATAIGAETKPILTAAASLAAKASAGAVWIENTGTMATSGNITAATTVSVVSSGALSLGHDVTGPDGATLTVSGTNATFSHSAGAIDGSDAAIVITADKMALSGGTIGSAATDTVTLRQLTPANAIVLGPAGDTTNNTLELSGSELSTITGALTVGRSDGGAIDVSAPTVRTTAGTTALLSDTGGIAVSNSFSSAGALTLTTAGSVTGGGAISSTSQSLSVSAVAGISLSGASTVRDVTLSNSGTDDIAYTGSSVGTGNTLALTAAFTGAGAGNITVSETSGSLATKVGGIVATAGKTVSLIGAEGVSIAHDVTGPAGVTLMADDMAIGAAVNAGGGRVVLRNNTLNRLVRLGSEQPGELSLTDAELDLITTTDILQIGRNDGSASGAITIDGALSPLNVSTLSLLTGAGVSGSGQTVTVTNLAASAAGAIDINVAATKVAALTSSGGITATSAGGFQIDTVDGVPGIEVPAGQTITLSAGGAVTQTAAGLVDANSTGSLILSGAGSFDLTTAPNEIGILAADNDGALSYRDASAFTVNGIDTSGGSGAVALNADAGSITLAGDILTNGGNVLIQRPVLLSGVPLTIDTDLAGGAANAGTVTFASTVDNASALIVDATVNGLGTAAMVDFQGIVGATPLASLNASGSIVRFGGNVTTTGTQTVAAPAIRTNGTHATTNSAINFGASSALTLQASTRLQSGNGAVTLGSVDDGASSFTLNLGDTGDTQTGSVTVNGAVTISALTTSASGFDILLNQATGAQASTIDSAVVFANSGVLTIGNDPADSFAFSGGVTKTTAGLRTLAGTVSTNNQVINFGTAGNVALSSATILDPGSGQIDLYSMTAPANVDLDIRGSGAVNLGTAAFDFRLGTGALILSSKTAGAIVVDGAIVTIGGLTMPVPAQTFTLDLRGNATTVSAAADLSNMGALTLGNDNGDVFNFPGGLTKTTSNIFLRGSVDTSAGPANLSLVTAGTLRLDDSTTLKTGSGTIGLSSVTVNGAGQSLALNGTGQATIASAALGTGTLDLSNRGANGHVALSGALTAGAFAAPAASISFDLSLNGGSISGPVNLANQAGILSIGASGFAFPGGATKTAGNIVFAGGTILTDGTNSINFNTSGAISVNASTIIGGDAIGDTGTITFSSVTVAAGQILTLGNTADANSFNVVGAVEGPGSLTINTTGTVSSTIDFQSTVGSTTALATLTVNDSYGVAFNDTVRAATVSLAGTESGQSISFGGALTVTAGLTTGTGSFDILFNQDAGAQSSTIAGATIIQTVAAGELVTGNDPADVIVFSGGLDVSGTAIRHLQGKIRSTGTAISLGAVTLDGDTTIDTTNAGGNAAGNDIALGSVSGAGRLLVVNAGTGGNLTTGIITASSLRLIANGSLGTAMTTPITTTVSNLEALSHNGTIFISNTGPLAVGFAGGDFEGLITGALQTSAANAIGLATDAGSDITFSQTVSAGAGGTFTATANSLGIGIGATITANGGIVLYPNADLLGIALNHGTGTFSLTTAELANLISTGTVSIGLTSGVGSTNAINVGGSGQVALGSTAYNLTLLAQNQNLTFAGGTTPVLALSPDKTLSIDIGTGVIGGSGVIDVSLPYGSTGGILNIAAAGNIGTGTGTSALQTQIDQLRVASSGSVYLSEANALQLGAAAGNVRSTGGLIDIAAGGAVAISDDVSTTGTGTTITIGGTAIALGANIDAVASYQITLSASSGAITRTAGSITTGGALALSAGTGIGSDGGGDGIADAAWIPTNVAVLRATASNGGIYIWETDGIALGDGSGGISATSGDIAVTAGGAITVQNTVEAAGAITFDGVGTITVTTASANIIGGAGLMLFNDPVTHNGGTISAGAVAAGNDAIRFAGDYAGTGGTLIGNGTTYPNIAFQGNVVLGTFSHNGGTIVLNGAGPQTFNSGGQIVAHFTVANAAGVTLGTNGVGQTGGTYALKLDAGFLDLNGLGWVADTAAPAPTANAFIGTAGSLTLGAGTELRCGSFETAAAYPVANDGANTLRTSGNVIILGGFSAPANSTLVMTGNAATLHAVPTNTDANIGNLHIGVGTTGTAAPATANVALGAALVLAGSLEINDEGSLDVSTSDYSITLSGNWTNRVGSWTPDDAPEPVTWPNSRFEPRQGTVKFTGSSISVSGNNRWYVFECTVANATIRFENGRIQRVLPGGTFRVKAAAESDRITLTRITGAPDVELDWVIANGPPPDQTALWHFDLLPTASLDLDYATIAFSDARLHPLSVPSSSVELFVIAAGDLDNSPGGETGITTYKWFNGIQLIYSYTEDSDGNGKIDRIRATVSGGAVNFDFSDFAISVVQNPGGSDMVRYDVDAAKGDNGFIKITTGPYAYAEFYIALKERPDYDTDATPTINIETNTSLRDTATLKRRLVMFENTPQAAIDTAPPVPLYTLTLPGHDQTYLRFSEPVYGAAGSIVATGLFTSPLSITNVTEAPAGNGIEEFLLTLNPAPTASLLFAQPQITFDAAMNDDATVATDYSTKAEYVYLMLPEPSYPVSYGDYSSYAKLSASPSVPANSIKISRRNHRLTDVLISRPPTSASDTNYFIWPIWARDSVTTEIAEEDYEGILPTGTDAANRTIGLVRDFTGTQWLRDQDITLEARVNPALGMPPAARVHFDADVPAEYLATAANTGSPNAPPGLWLPAFSGSAFNGIVPEPNGMTSAYEGTSSGAPLWQFPIPSSNPKVKSGSTLDFFFTLGAANSVNPLYAARLAIIPTAPIPTDWYKRILPFSFDIRDVTKQRGSVTILNNVINPTVGEMTRVSYQLAQAGRTVVSVFTLDGDLVKILYRGTRAAGDYTAAWDGKNEGGRPVARGMYFIRVVGPQLDEIRKVMVVK